MDVLNNVKIFVPVLMKHTTLYRILAYSGSAPFVACAILHILGHSQIPNIGTTLNVALVYGLLIVSFMSGIHWGVYLSHHEKISLNLFIISNVITLISWFVYLLGGVLFQVLALIAAFLCLLAIDLKLIDDDIIDIDYYNMRVGVTIIVVISLLFLLR